MKKAITLYETAMKEGCTLEWDKIFPDLEPWIQTIEDYDMLMKTG
jgi:hypothetical protein